MNKDKNVMYNINELEEELIFLALSLVNKQIAKNPERFKEAISNHFSHFNIKDINEFKDAVEQVKAKFTPL